MDTLNLGTKEIISFDVADRLNTISDISTYTVEYKVTDEEEVELIAWTPVENVDLMRVDILLDTTNGTIFKDGMILKIYIRPLINPEAPILGPFEYGLS
jgi:hypothetical protein